MKLKVIKHHTLYKDKRFHAAFPSIIKLDAGNYLLGFRRAPDCNWLMNGIENFDSLSFMDHVSPRSHICLLNLDENLLQIEEEKIYPIDPEAGDQDVSLLNLGDGKVLVTGFSWYPVPGYIVKQRFQEKAEKIFSSTGCGFRYWGTFTGLSNDHGQSWEYDHKYITDSHISSEGENNQKIGPTYGPVIDNNGELLLPVYEGDGTAVLWSSLDKGRSWRLKSTIASDPQKSIKFQEPSIIKTPSGKLIAFMRTANAESRLATAQSLDGGGSWKPYKLHGIKGQPFHALQINYSKILLSYGYREEPFGVRCRILDAECEGIDTAAEIIVRDDGVCADIGYPWAVQLADDRVMVCYYWTGEDGVRFIQGTVLGLLDDTISV